MTGYLGARLIRWRESAKDTPGCFEYIAERRCSWTGGQLTSGDVLRQLDIEPHRYTNAYSILRRVSEGIGIDYVDRAARHHKLYMWGDIHVVAERLAARSEELVHRDKKPIRRGKVSSTPSELPDLLLLEGLDEALDGDCFIEDLLFDDDLAVDDLPL
jgi:hypothetical protein